MPMSEAAMDGIRDHGRGWKYDIRLSDLTKQLGEFADDAPELEVEKVVVKVLDRIKAHLTNWPNREYSVPLDLAAEDLFAVADCGIEEVRFAMNTIYDVFDYHRVKVI